ncbi:MAG: hypothetical protein SWH78_04255 [Thermodesulfobacteriota bacterium]|nr:hypothetical protein [Thermodesulfobacteriota bacterium]
MSFESVFPPDYKPGLTVRGGPGKHKRMAENRQETLTKIREIDSQIDFKMTLRGWCYMLEQEWGLAKSDFSTKAMRYFGEYRERGQLPLDFCLEDDNRAFSQGESLVDAVAPDDFVQDAFASLRDIHTYYKPLSFWNNQKYYIEMLVEKADLVSLFRPICSKFNIRIANTHGNASYGQRYAMINRFRQHEEEGRKPVLLYCGDHDPSGLMISDRLKHNFKKLELATGWSPDNLLIDRFGLNYDFIEKHNLSWIDSLITASGENLASSRHHDYKKAYVQSYINEYGCRKVEANAIVVRPEMGRKLCYYNSALHRPSCR